MKVGFIMVGWFPGMGPKRLYGYEATLHQALLRLRKYYPGGKVKGEWFPIELFRLPDSRIWPFVRMPASFRLVVKDDNVVAYLFRGKA